MDKKELRNETLQMFYAHGWRYIARNKNDHVYIFTEKPTKGRARWLCKKGNRDYYLPFAEIFDDIRFENAEPFDIAHELGAGDGNAAE